MSCRTTPAGSAWTTFSRLESGLTDVQTLSTFHALRREGRGVPAPTEAEWAEFVESQRSEMQEAGFSEARMRSLTSRMERAAAERPDGASWYALRNIRDRARQEASNVETHLRGLASMSGQTYETLAARYNTYLNEVDRGRSVTAPEGYETARDAWRRQGLPADHGTYTALTRIAAEAQQAAAADSADRPRRVEMVQFPNSRAIHSAGYDPHDGRLEVVFRRTDRDGNTVGTSRTYAYHGVPAEIWRQMSIDDSPGNVYNREVRNHDQYRYESRDAEDAGAHRRCADCGQWWAPGHACPTRSVQPEVVSQSADGRVRLVSAVAATPVTEPTVEAIVESAAESAVEPVVEDDVEVSEWERRVRAYEEQGLDRSDAQSAVDAEDRLAESGVATSRVMPEGAAGEVSAADYDAALADLRARLAEDATEQELDDEPEPERPEPVAMRSVGVYGSYERINARRMPAGDVALRDVATVPPMRPIRAAALNQPVIVPVSYQGHYRYNYTANPNELPSGSFNVSGSVVFDRPSANEYTVTARELRCSCAAYRQTYHCPHVDFVLERYRSYLTPPPRGAGASASPADIAAAQRVAEEAARQDWMRSEEYAAEARERHAAVSDPRDSYTNNFAAFEADHDAALARKARGEHPVPYMSENALNGEFTRGSGRGFGVEMEFDFPSEMDYQQRREALSRIGQELYDAGLTPTAHQQGYHASARRGYTDQHAQGWSFEQDCTVSGEIVSPVMYDEPETWQNIEKVCEIIRRHGGIANAKTGSHVHVGAPNMTTQTATELMRMTNQHEDIMYRLSQNPERASHRPMRWCGPNNEVPQGGYTDMWEVTRIRSHNYGMNLGGVRGASSDHPEVRYWDGTLDPAVIQAQVKVSAGLVQAAERNAPLGNSRRNRETIGSHHQRLAAVRGRSRRALTSEELEEDTATVRSLMDTLFTRREDKAQVTALFAVTKWQRPRR